jgi:hypothetical protein
MEPREVDRLREAIGWRDDIARSGDRAPFRVVGDRCADRSGDACSAHLRTRCNPGRTPCSRGKQRRGPPPAAERRCDPRRSTGPGIPAIRATERHRTGTTPPRSRSDWPIEEDPERTCGVGGRPGSAPPQRHSCRYWLREPPRTLRSCEQQRACDSGRQQSSARPSWRSSDEDHVGHSKRRMTHEPAGGRMASEMLQRDDLSVYVVAGVPKSFKKKPPEVRGDRIQVRGRRHAPGRGDDGVDARTRAG